MPETLGFQADLAHTYLYLLGYNAPEHALVKPGYTEAEFWPAYEKMVDETPAVDDRLPRRPERRRRARRGLARQDGQALPGRRSPTASSTS